MRFILLYNLLGNMVFFALSFTDLLIFMDPAAQAVTKYHSRLAVAGYSALGLPLVLAGFWGVAYLSERHLRTFAIYMILDTLVNAAYTAEATFNFVPCAAGRVHAGPGEQDIFHCSHPRGVLLAALGFYVGVQACLLYPAWSYVSDVEYGDGREGDGGLKMPSRQLAVAEQWSGFRRGPLDYLHGRMKGEHGAGCETLKLMGSGFHQRVADDMLPYLPAGKLV